MNALFTHNLMHVLPEARIGEILPQSSIDLMISFIDNYGSRMFFDEVWNGAFASVSYAYIHPCDEMRYTDRFQEIQRAFINAYC